MTAAQERRDLYDLAEAALLLAGRNLAAASSHTMHARHALRSIRSRPDLRQPLLLGANLERDYARDARKRARRARLEGRRLLALATGDGDLFVLVADEGAENDWPRLPSALGINGEE